MKKKILVITLSAAMLLAGCGGTSTTPPETASSQPPASMTEESSVAVSEETSLEDESEEVEVILYAFLVNQTIDEYIQHLEEENPDAQYSVYNDEYYVSVIRESDRKDFLKKCEDESFLTEEFKALFSDESYGGAFVDIEYDDQLQHFSLYVDKEKYEENKFACGFGAGLTITAISDRYQAYHLTMPEDRITEVKIIDDATKEVLSDD